MASNFEAAGRHIRTKMQRQQWQRHIAETFASNKHNTNLESLESDSDSCCSSDSDFDGNIVLSD